MGQLPTGPTRAVRATVELVGGGVELRFDAIVPAGPITMQDMFPLLCCLADGIVSATVTNLAKVSKLVSCREGCSACCRQLVPISEVEARALRDLVEALPKPRSSVIHSRFSRARLRLEQAGLLERLRTPASWTTEGFRTLALDYLALGIVCPFLEEESCSIYPDRPITCREFLVTSPARFCSAPTAETVEVVQLPLRVCAAVARYDSESQPPTFHLGATGSWPSPGRRVVSESSWTWENLRSRL